MMKTSLVWTMMLLMILLSGCRAIGSEMESHPGNTISPDDKLQQISEKPMIPEKLSLNQNGIPVLQVYQVDEEETNEMDIESYLEGVLAGEMKNDWPIEALKAQAILARTFVLKFCTPPVKL